MVPAAAQGALCSPTVMGVNAWGQSRGPGQGPQGGWGEWDTSPGGGYHTGQWLFLLLAVPAWGFFPIIQVHALSKSLPFPAAWNTYYLTSLHYTLYFHISTLGQNLHFSLSLYWNQWVTPKAIIWNSVCSESVWLITQKCDFPYKIYIWDQLFKLLSVWALHVCYADSEVTTCTRKLIVG